MSMTRLLSFPLRWSAGAPSPSTVRPLEIASWPDVSVTTAGTPEDKFAKQADLAKTAFEEALSNLRELVDTLQKSQSEAVDVLTKRAVANIDDVKAAVAKIAKK